MMKLDATVPFPPRQKCLQMSALGKMKDAENWDIREEAASSGSTGASEKLGIKGGECGELFKATLQSPEKRGGLNGSTQHLL